MPSISLRGQQVPLSPFRKLVRLADAAKAMGKEVYHLNIGQPDILTPPAAIAAFQKKDIQILEYSDAIGIASYRKKLTQYYQSFDIDVTANDILITTGGSEGLQFLMYACFNRGGRSDYTRTLLCQLQRFCPNSRRGHQANYLCY